MIDTLWEEYRAWAARARQLQASSQSWNTAALSAAGVAAFLGALSTQTAGYAVGTYVSLGAAAAVGLVPFLGKEILATGSEAKWIRARATAEAIKSECFRYAARAGAYAGDNPENLLDTRCAALATAATQEGLASKPDPAGPEGDKRRPTDRFDADWYLSNRIDEQIRYYATKQAEHERVATRLRWLALAASGLAVILGVIGATYHLLTPWIGVLTTVAAALAAQGLKDRRQFLAANYSAMVTSLNRTKARAKAAGDSVADLVTRAEDLLETEHGAWTKYMTSTIPSPPVAPPVPAPGERKGNENGRVG